MLPVNAITKEFINFWHKDSDINLCKIENVCESVNSLPTKTNPELEFCYIEISDVSHMHGVRGAKIYSFKDAPQSARQILQKNDTIISNVRTYLKACAFIENKEHENLICSTGFTVLRPGKNIFPKYLYWVVLTDSFISSVDVYSNGVTYPTISSKKLLQLTIPLPPIEIQKSIVNFLNKKISHINQLVEKKQKIMDKLEEQKYSVITEAIDGNNEFPKEKIGNVFQVINGATPSTNVENYWNGGITWVTPKDVGKLKQVTIFSGQKFITTEGYNNCGASLIPKNSIIISTRAPIGHLAITGAEMCFNQGCRGLVPNNSVLTDYAYWAFLAHKHDFIALGQGTTFAELSSEKLKSIMIPLPDITIQKSIATFLNKKVSNMNATIDKIKKSIEKIQELKNSLITEAVTGQLNIEEN